MPDTNISGLPVTGALGDVVGIVPKHDLLRRQTNAARSTSLGPLPDPIAKLLSVQASVQQRTVEAAVRGSKEFAREALLIDPLVNSATAAAKVPDELWEVNSR
jgi:alpha-galactosidase/6-phospho-beta-glucosidase family protein